MGRFAAILEWHEDYKLRQIESEYETVHRRADKRKQRIFATIQPLDKSALSAWLVYFWLRDPVERPTEMDASDTIHTGRLSLYNSRMGWGFDYEQLAKVCTRCKRARSLMHFTWDKTNETHHSHCKDCRASYYRRKVAA